MFGQFVVLKAFPFEDMITIDKLIEQLAAEGGAIVTTNDCSVMEIADARATNRMAVREDGIGFIRRTAEWLELQKSREPKFDLPKERCLELADQEGDHNVAAGSLPALGCALVPEHPLAKPKLGEHTSQSGCPTCAILAKHTKALQELYDKHGVGDTARRRYHFWDSQHPNGWNISHINRNDHARVVAVFEASWLADQFPEDFEFC